MPIGRRLGHQEGQDVGCVEAGAGGGASVSNSDGSACTSAHPVSSDGGVAEWVSDSGIAAWGGDGSSSDSGEGGEGGEGEVLLSGPLCQRW